MRKNKILPVTALLLASAALIANHSVARIQPPAPHHLPVAAFPRVVGTWKAGPDQAVDPDVFKQLTTARIVDRSYTNRSGQSVDLMLVTADSGSDLHNPKVCFPSQGWTLGHEQTLSVGKEAASFMTAIQGSQQIDILYWLTGGVQARKAAPRTLEAIRARVLGVEDQRIMSGDSLMVRLIAPHSDTSEALLRSFASQVQAPLRQIVAAANHAAR